MHRHSGRLRTASRAGRRSSHRQGTQGFVIGFRDFADRALLEPYPHEIIRLAAAGDILGALKRNNCRELVLIGPVRRPAWRDLRPDAEGARILARLGRAIFSGDDGLLGAVVRVLGEEGFHVRGAHEFLEHATGRSGTLGRVLPDAQAKQDIARGVEVLKVMAALDIGQGALSRTVSCWLWRLWKDRCDAGALWAAHAGGKWRRSGEDAQDGAGRSGGYADDRAGDAGECSPERIAGVAFQPGVTLMTDPAGCVKLADRYGLFLYGLTPEDLKEK